MRSLTAWLADQARELLTRTMFPPRCHCGGIADRYGLCTPCRHRAHHACWCSIRPGLADDINQE
ncbi:MAG: hypothetical protein QM582_10100 [Micropruina sp.]|uniref:hypothetical protein n=1 Tax=Micropruina sp. TaxID=2737536 RepID=UPI0039E5BA54